MQDWYERLRESVLTRNRHHLLLIGPRGIGKTHAVAMIQHKLEADADVRDKLRIAWLNEDESATSFLDLLMRILRTLQDRYPKEFTEDAISAVYDLPTDLALERAGRILLDGLESRVLLVAVENLDLLFAGLGDGGQKQWRAFIQENPVFTTLATSQQLFDGVSSRSNAFYGFFQIDYLKPLSLCEAIELLRKIAELKKDADLVAFLDSPDGRARVRALHHLSGGNHRVYIVLSEFITRESLDELIGPFEKMLDELTPYYQERLRSLSPQQRRIVEFLCTATRTIAVKEIARRVFASEQTVAGQLKKLRELGYVVAHPRGKESLHELTEPLMRLSFELKENRREPIRLIVEFLRIWYQIDDLKSKLELLPLFAIREREHVSAAVTLAESSENPLVLAIENDLEVAMKENCTSDVVAAREELAHVRGNPADWTNLIVDLINAARYEDVLKYLDKTDSLQDDKSLTYRIRGDVLYLLERYGDAMKSYDKITFKSVDISQHDVIRLFAYFRCDMSEKGFHLLEGILSCKDAILIKNLDIAVGSMLIDIITINTSDFDQIESKLKKLISIYRNYQLSVKFSHSMIISFEKLVAKSLSIDLLDHIGLIFQREFAEDSEIETPLRLFSAGIMYLKSKDSRILLDLIEPERQFLEMILKIEPTDAKSVKLFD